MARLEPDQRRAQILTCASELFAERGYAGVSMDGIAEAAGVRRGLVNHYFGAKRDLYLAVIKRLLTQFDQAFPTPTTDGPGPQPEAGGTRQVIEGHVSRWLDVVEGEAEVWLAVIAAEGFGRDPDVERLVDRAREAMVDEVIAVLGLDDSAALRVVLRAYAGLAEATTCEWLRRGSIDRHQAEVILSRSLEAMVTEVAPSVPQRAASSTSS